uniref:Uncharacterized protein MANES_12G045800 n=1 Tax=Rhizophora mucronata TaxID=61149 RepID=A0A2P2KA91_RHIMU
MNSSEGAASRPLNSRAFLWRPQYPPGSNQDYILPTKFLFKLSHKPNMDLSESFPQSERNMNNNSLSISRYIYLNC